jgi:starch phosphorylase
MTRNTPWQADGVAEPSIEDDRTSLSAAGLARAAADHLRSACRPPAVADSHDYYRALALAVRDRMQDRSMKSRRPISIRTERSPGR